MPNFLEFPIGTVIIWQNTTIPAGWQVCDGTNGTRNLVGYFVQGASIDGDVGVSAVNTSHTHTTPSTDAVAAHSHGGTINGNTGAIDNTVDMYEGGPPYGYPATADHDHTLSATITAANGHSHTGGATGSATSLPKHILRVFIQRVS